MNFPNHSITINLKSKKTGRSSSCIHPSSAWPTWPTFVVSWNSDFSASQLRRSSAAAVSETKITRKWWEREWRTLHVWLWYLRTTPNPTIYMYFFSHFHSRITAQISSLTSQIINALSTISLSIPLSVIIKERSIHFSFFSWDHSNSVRTTVILFLSSNFNGVDW